jgi:NADP-dependent 3-hydroxy acid dehydrogenase YdfG
MQDKVIVITGASAGIGRAAAVLLASRGARLILVARRRELLDEVVASCGANADPAVADVTRRDQVNAVAARALDRFGRIDVWINNAGRGISRMPSELTDDDVDEMMLVNVKSALYGMQAVLPISKRGAMATSSTSRRCSAACRLRSFGRRTARRSIS